MLKGALDASSRGGVDHGDGPACGGTDRQLSYPGTCFRRSGGISRTTTARRLNPEWMKMAGPKRPRLIVARASTRPTTRNIGNQEDYPGSKGHRSGQTDGTHQKMPPISVRHCVSRDSPGI